MKKKVLIPTKLDPAAADILTANGRYDVVQDESTDLMELCRQHSDANALIVRSDKVTSEVIDALPSLKVIIRAGSGYNTIDTKYARSRQVDVMNTPGANANAVAEEVIALMLADARHVVKADESVRSGKWEKKKFVGSEIAGKTVGIVGLGSIGQVVARRLTGFDVRLLGYDPVVSRGKADNLGVELAELETVFRESDYITLHIPENEETRGMVNRKLLELTKEGATIVNCARAGIVVEDDLRQVKSARKLRYLNDVYEADSEGHKSIHDVADLMMPHLGASTAEAGRKAATQAAQQLIDYNEKGITSFIVNRDIPEGLDRSYCELANILARFCRRISGPTAKLKSIETSIYGDLKPFADWLLVPIVAGFWPNFELTLDHEAARQYLDEMGVDHLNRQTDPAKAYGSSITVDLVNTLESGYLEKVSVRGTVVEGVIMVSRINEFDRLYFEPHGNTALFLYEDRPGVLGTIGVALAKAGINIEDMRNPHDSKTNHSLAIMKINMPVPADVIDEITGQVNALASFHLEL